MTKPDPDGPILIELDSEETPPSPAEVPAISEPDISPEGRAMQATMALAARPPSVLAGWFWRLLLALVAFFVSLAAWDAVIGLISRNSALGYAALALLAAFGVVCLLLSIREIAALSRLRRVESLQSEAERILAEDDVPGARNYLKKLARFYAGRSDTAWGRERLEAREAEVFDARTGLEPCGRCASGPIGHRGDQGGRGRSTASRNGNGPCSIGLRRHPHCANRQFAHDPPDCRDLWRPRGDIRGVASCTRRRGTSCGHRRCCRGRRFAWLRGRRASSWKTVSAFWGRYCEWGTHGPRGRRGHGGVSPDALCQQGKAPCYRPRPPRFDGIVRPSVLIVNFLGTFPSVRALFFQKRLCAQVSRACPEDCIGEYCHVRTWLDGTLGCAIGAGHPRRDTH